MGERMFLAIVGWMGVEVNGRKVAFCRERRFGKKRFKRDVSNTPFQVLRFKRDVSKEAFQFPFQRIVGKGCGNKPGKELAMGSVR
jgi:hypothetical protein